MQTLEQWLSVATRGLCAAAVERVRAEIGDHYQSALESARAASVDAVEAERRAVAALGDAKTANRQYRRVLLTKGEDILLRGMMSSPMPLEGFSKRRMLFGQTLATILMLQAVAIILTATIKFGGFGYVAAAFILQGVIFRTIHVRSIRAGWMIRVVRWGVLGAGATMALLSGLNPGLALVQLLVVAHFEYKRFVLRGKLPVGQWPKRLYN